MRSHLADRRELGKNAPIIYNAAQPLRASALLHRMFVSVPALEFEVPAGIAPMSGARYWRAVQLSLQLPWFIAGFEMADDRGPSRLTMCFAWDTDLVSSIQTIKRGRLLDLVCMVPPWRSPSGSWEARTIVAVHRAIGTDEGGEGESYLFETSDGVELTSFDGGPCRTARRVELVARVPYPS